MKTGRLSTRQRKALQALIENRTIQQAAQAAGIGERTIYKYLDDPQFRAALAEAEGDLIDQATRQLLQLQDPAIKVMTWAMNHADNPPSVRLRAAQAVLDYLLKLRELRNLEERLTNLEVKVYGQSKAN